MAVSNIRYDQIIFTDLVREFRTAKCDFFKKEANKLGKETKKELEERTEKVINNIRTLCSSSPTCKVLIVSHIDFFKHIIKKHGQSGQQIKLANAEMTRLTLDL